MSWRIATRHTSVYRYESPVSASLNEVRLTPSSGLEQLVLDSELAVSPTANVLRYVDYWGTLVHGVEVHEEHRELKVVATSLVETAPAPDETAFRAVSWEEISSLEVRDRHAELLAPTTFAPFDADLAAEARAITVGATPYEAAMHVARHVRAELRYEPGSTEVSTSAVEAWQQRSGVCQDFAHLSLSMLRQLGLPARYVSGYLHPREDAGVGQSERGASHAWVEVYLGTFLAFDPTNGEPVGERHVTVARGRDYADVPPFRGVYHGGELASLSVEVELTRTS